MLSPSKRCPRDAVNANTDMIDHVFLHDILTNPYKYNPHTIIPSVCPKPQYPELFELPSDPEIFCCRASSQDPKKKRPRRHFEEEGLRVSGSLARSPLVHGSVHPPVYFKERKSLHTH